MKMRCGHPMEILIVILLLLGVVKPNPVSGNGATVDVNVIKKILLEKLGLLQEPETSIHDIPQPVIMRSSTFPYNQTDEDYEVRKTTVTMTGKATREVNTFEFTLDHNNLFKSQAVQFAVLNLYRHAKHPSGLHIQMSRKRKEIMRIKNGEEKWVSKNITNYIKKWLQSRNNKYTLKITCGTDDKSCIHGNKLPFIDIEFHDRAKERSKRTTDCKPDSSNCCRRSIHISIKDLKWENWFLGPKEFYYYYCSGSCENQKKSLYGQIVATFIKSKSSGCCMPTKLQPMHVMHVDIRKTVFVKQISNIMAAECACGGS